MLHIVFLRIIKHVSQIQAIFVTTQEMDQLGVTFTIIQIVVKLKTDSLASTPGQDYM
jgi:hypothetical protein